MTRDKVLAMEPGIELDDEIRLMFGWTKYREKEDGTFACWVTPEGKQWTYPSSGRLPRYSTDISAAWEVEEKIKVMSIDVVRQYVSNIYEVSGHGFVAIHASPEDRCKAALLAVLGL